MKITESTMQLTSAHAAVQRQQQREHLQYWRDGQTPVERKGQETHSKQLHGLGLGRQRNEYQRSAQISQRAAALQPQTRVLDPQTAESAEEEPAADLQTSIIKNLVERITGRHFKLFQPSDLKPQTETTTTPVTAPQTANPSTANGETKPAGWGLAYDYYESRYESETTTFSAQGIVKTADGKEIAIQVDLNMSRESFSEQQISLRAGDALKDPLVLNFNGNAAALAQTQFSFDLDQDGRTEQIAFVSPDSGFLALDRNQDGAINDGGELFGPTSGDGFNELAAADVDSNGWIDENDPIYERLRIWSRDAAGKESLVGLGQKGVGAIYLGRVDTPFQLQDVNNNLLGQVRSSGVFLSENGGVGTIQQLDLRV